MEGDDDDEVVDEDVDDDDDDGCWIDIESPRLTPPKFSKLNSVAI